MIYFTILSYAFNICIFNGLVYKVYTTINEHFNLKYTSDIVIKFYFTYIG